MMSRRCRGQSLAEYAILLALIGLVLVIGAESPLEVLFRAIQGYYGRFTFSLSMP
jgi:Flp pilus assembly pilin Flp